MTKESFSLQDGSIEPRPAINTRHILWLCLALVAVTLSVYWQVGNHDFVNFDDDLYVYKNPHVVTGLTASNIMWAFTAMVSANWHPLTLLSHMVDFQLYGFNAGGHHLTSVVIHAIATVVLLLFLVRMTGALWSSGLVAALFALHPMHVESVAWVAERKDVLGATFWFLTLLLYVEYVATRKQAYYLLTLMSFALGLMSKPMLVTLPIVMLLLDLWPLKRVGELPSSTRLFQWLQLVKEKIPFFFLMLLSIVITIYFQSKGEAIESLEALPFALRLENAPIAYVSYIGQMFWPHDLAVFYPYPDAYPFWKVIGAVTLLGLITAWVLWAGRRHQFLLTGWFWFLITLVPVIGLVQVGEQAMADRYTYIPYSGLFIMVVWGVPVLTRKLPYRRMLHGLLAAVALTSCIVLTWQQIGYWRDKVTLFSHALQVTASNTLAHNNLGLALAENGDLDGAIREYREVLALDPNYDLAHNNLGIVYAAKGDLVRAIEEFRTALAISPNLDNAHHNLGLALAKKGEMEAAIEEFRAALAINPDYFDSHNFLGAALAEIGDLDGAIAEFQAALAINHGSDSAHNNLGTLYARKGDFDAAIREFTTALALEPNGFEGHYNLGQAYRIIGDLDSAIREFRETVRLNPESVEAQRELAAVIAQREPSRNRP